MKPKILIVDDEQDVCDAITHYFTKRDYSMISALSAKEAVLKLLSEKPDLVLLDIRMPVMDGIECLRVIRKFEREIPVIMLTAVTDAEIAKLTLELGATDYITKPLSFEAIERAICVYLFLNTVK